MPLAGYVRRKVGALTRDRVPLDWALTQTNLGNALQTLGQRAPGTARLEKAVAAYYAALDEFTPDRVPLDWAGASGMLAAALLVLAERRKHAGLAVAGVDILREAEAVLRNGWHAVGGDNLSGRIPAAEALVVRLSGGVTEG